MSPLGDLIAATHQKDKQSELNLNLIRGIDTHELDDISKLLISYGNIKFDISCN